jgi:IS5 family transposase
MLNRFRLHRALEKLVDLARRHDVPLRLSYRRLAKRAALTALEERFADLLALGVRVRFQDHRQRGRKVYALHAPEVECIGKGKARAPYEFGYKVSVATPATKPKGGQFVLHAKALHGNPFDGHTLEPVIAELEALTGIETRRIRADKGYRGHNHTQKFRVWISGQVRRVSAARCAAALRSSRSSGTSRPSTTWAAITSKAATATASTPCSPCRLQLRSAPALARAAFARLDANAACRLGHSPKHLKYASRWFFMDD